MNNHIIFTKAKKVAGAAQENIKSKLIQFLILHTPLPPQTL
jgi:hypothetical protein